jgi:tape measure domain-containing protein
MSDLTLAIHFTANGGQVVVKNVRDISSAVGSVNQEFAQVVKTGEAAKSGFNSAAEGAAEAEKFAISLTKALGFVAASFSSMKLIDIADDWGQMSARIRQATDNSAEYDYVQQRMVSSANDTYRAINETREGFIRMSPILRDMNYSLGQSIDIVDSFSALLVTNAAKADRAASAQDALSKAIQTGRLESDGWQTIFGVMPSILDNLTAATGKTGSEIRELGISGKMSINDLTNALLLNQDKNLAAVEDMPTTVRDALQSMANLFENYIGQQNEAFGATAALAGSIVDVSDALYNITTQPFDDLNPQLQATLNTAELLVTIAGVAGFAAFLKYGASQYLVFQNALLLNTQSVRTVSTLGLVTTTAGTSTVALNALAMAQRLVLGPVGLLIGVLGAAAVAFNLYEDAAEDAKKKNEQLQKSFGEWSNQRKADAYNGAVIQLNELNAQIEATQAKIRSARSTMPVQSTQFGSIASSDEMAALKLLDELKAKKAELNSLIEELNKNFNAGLPGLNEYSDKLEGNASSASVLKDDLLKLYNQQMLSAQAISATGAALTGIDLELFKATFVEATKLPEAAKEAIMQFAAEAKVATANLNLDTYLKQLQAELALLDIKLQKGEAEYNIQKALSAYTGVNPARTKALTDELKLLEKKKLAVTGKDTLDAMKQETALLRIRLNQGEKEYDVQKALYQLKGGDPAVLAAIEAEVRAQQQLNEQLDIRKYLTDGTYDDLLDSLTQIGDIGGAAGNAIVDAFGSVADQFAAMAEQQDEFTKKFLELSEARKKVEKEVDPVRRTKALEKADAVERSLMEDQLRGQLGNYATLTGAASKMFSENSKGRQVLHRMETAFAAIETALAIKKAAANALTAITNQGGGDPYTAFARIAAMAALMAGLGVFSGSASGGTSAASNQQSQGTGTVLGDSSAKSESIANSLERIESLELDQYAELRSINTAIRDLNAGIAKLAVNLVASYGRFDEGNYQGDLGKDYNLQLGSTAGALVLGGFIGAAVDNMLGGLLSGITNKVLGGLFGSTKKELVDSGISFAAQELGDILASGLVDATLYDTIKVTKKKLFGLSKSTSEKTEYRDLDQEVRAEFGRVFSYIGNSVTEAVKLLGLTTTRDLENFVISLPKISFKGLSGDEIEEELQALFSQQGDLMAKYLVPGIAEFQKMGEGLYDTLIRVAQEQAVFNASMDSLGLELSRFGSVTSEVQIRVAQSLIELMGGIEEFSSTTSKYFEAFYSESEQMAAMQKQIDEQFKSMGLTLPTTRDGFKALVDGLDLTTDAGQAMFAALMSLVPMMDQFYDAAEDAAKAAEKAAEAEQKLAAERNKFNSDIQSELIRLDFSPFELAMDDLNQWYADAKAEAEQLGASTALLTQLYNKKREALATEYMNKSIASAETAMSSLVADYQRTVDQLGQALAQVLDSISSMAGTIRADILNIRKTLPEFDSVGYYADQVYSLTAQLGTGTAAAQLDVIGKLKAAMLDRYSAELEAMDKNMEAINAEQAAREELYENQLEQINALRDAAKAMKDAASALLYGDLSTLTAGERLQQLQSQYNTAVAKARGGDAEAYSQVQSLGEQLLQMSRDYDPANYGAVFDSVLGTFNELGNKNFITPTAPAPHPAIAAYEETKIALARQTIAQLELLAGTTDSLGALATAENTAAINALTAQFTADTAKVSAILETELAAIRAQMPAQTDAIVEALHLLDTSVRDGTVYTGTVMQDVADAVGVSNTNLSTIAQLAGNQQPIVVPAPNVDVVVNVNYTPPPSNPGEPTQPQVAALQSLQALTAETNSQLQKVVSSNESISRELADTSSQLIAMQRVS